MRLLSGSVTPFSLLKNLSFASTILRLMPKFLELLDSFLVLKVILHTLVPIKKGDRVYKARVGVIYKFLVIDKMIQISTRLTSSDMKID